MNLFGEDDQAVKQKCSVPFVLEGRMVDEAHNGLSPSPGGLTGGGARILGRCDDWVDPRNGEVMLGDLIWSCEGGCEAWSYYRDDLRNEDDRECWERKILQCNLCKALVKVRCLATRDDICGPCAERHRKDIARVIRSGMTGDRPEGFFFVTLTGPGGDVLPFDPASCSHGPDVKCAGGLGCRTERYRAARWNKGAPRRWNDFMTALRKALGVDVQYCGSWETQKRGVLHRHVVLWAPGVSHKRMAATVKWCASRRHVGFGRQIDVQPISGVSVEALGEVTGAVSADMAQRAGYVAKYATKGGDLAVTLDVETGEIVQGGYRRWSASRRWGCTMGSIRRERAEWCKVRRAAAVPRSDSSVGGGAAGALDIETESYGSALVEGLLAREFGAVTV